jgi:hypothetical protein
MLLSSLLFIVAVGWGIAFAFPEPDASPEKAARILQHTLASGWLMLAACVLFMAALARLLWVKLRAK